MPSWWPTRAHKEYFGNKREVPLEGYLQCVSKQVQWTLVAQSWALRKVPTVPPIKSGLANDNSSQQDSVTVPGSGLDLNESKKSGAPGSSHQAIGTSRPLLTGKHRDRHWRSKATWHPRAMGWESLSWTSQLPAEICHMNDLNQHPGEQLRVVRNRNWWWLKPLTLGSLTMQQGQLKNKQQRKGTHYGQTWWCIL
jgi:hypothetical protein